MYMNKVEKVDSTNEYLKRKSDLKNFDLVFATKQTDGKGRRGRKWYSEDGGAWFSFAIEKDQHLSEEEHMKLSLISGLSVLETLNRYEDLNFKIKWPNDIFVNGRKIAGILIEKIENFYIIGIGINLNIKEFGDLEHIATSLALLTGKEYNIEEVISGVANSFKYNYFNFLRGEWNIELDKINQNLYLKDTKVKFVTGDLEKEGIVKKISKDGNLILEINNNEEEFIQGEIILENNM